MSDMNRRDLTLALTAFASLSALRADAQPVTASQPDADAPRLIHSEIFAFDQLPAHTASNGMVSRSVLRGTLATGEFVEVHETMLPAGEMPHPPHRHTHSEFLLIREGTLQVDSDGKQGTVHPGDVVFTASAVLHSLKNIGQTPASYFVVAVGLQKAII
jgi:mannose-6-phosphate isomerase-like protein (cupin superfamily)